MARDGAAVLVAEAGGEAMQFRGRGQPFAQAGCDAALLYLSFGNGMGDVDRVLGDTMRRAIIAWRMQAGLGGSDRLADLSSPSWSSPS